MGLRCDRCGLNRPREVNRFKADLLGERVTNMTVTGLEGMEDHFLCLEFRADGY